MTIRFAAPPTAYGTRLSPVEAREALRAPDNDNFQPAQIGEDAALYAALRHFAQHGLAAASIARRRAEEGLREDNMQQYRWWLDICRALDRRMARELAAGINCHA